MRIGMSKVREALRKEKSILTSQILDVSGLIFIL
jgi:hypothetical protein